MTEISNTPSVDTIVGGYRKRAILRVALVVAAALILFTTVVIDVITGPADLSFWRVAHVIFDPSVATAKEEVIIWDLRLPIAMMAIVVGAMLGVSGAELQTILNNPLAEPFTLGLSMAASFGAAVAIVLGWSVLPGVGALFVTVNAFFFAMAASLLLFFVTRLRGADPETMILMGIAMMFTFNALLAFLQYGASE